MVMSLECLENACRRLAPSNRCCQCPGLFEITRDGLQAGSCCGNDPHGSGRDRIGETQCNPVDNRCAGIWAHDQQTLVSSEFLQGDLVLDRYVVAEEKDV